MPTAVNRSIGSFETLVRKIKETFLAGRERMRREMIETYWQSGKYIDEHILHHKSRAEYGRQILGKLSERTEISERSLQEMLQVYRRFPKIPRRGAELPWRVITKLSSIKDEDLRETFTRRAIEGKWTGEQAQQKIKLEIRPYERTEAPAKKNGKSSARAVSLPPEPPPPPLKASAGTLYTYRLLQPEQVHPEKPYVLIDLGFAAYQRLYQSARDVKISADGTRATKHGYRPGFKPGEIIESAWDEKKEDYTIEKSRRREEELFTYKALVERVVDGDTLRVKVDLGFDTWTRQYLRLRAIDCAEIETEQGKAAKKCVEALLAKTPFILLKSTRSDKYDRYLADVWAPAAKDETQPGVYLNQLLLDKSFAIRLRE